MEKNRENNMEEVAKSARPEAVRKFFFVKIVPVCIYIPIIICSN